MSSIELENLEEFDGVSDLIEDDLYDHIPEPIIPTIDTEDEDLESSDTVVGYSTRGPGDFVVSGPLPSGWGPGRHFNGRKQAYMWAVGKYGGGNISLLPEVHGRWAFLVKHA